MKTSILLASVFTLAGCAGMCGPKDRTCIDNANSVDMVLGAAIAVGAAIEAPPAPTVTTETRTCTRDVFGNESCTTTKEGE
ncbi:MAG TPA: hypothetical protein VF450_26395 [Noviherbaspirillum sp.]